MNYSVIDNIPGFNCGRKGWLVGISDTKVIPTGQTTSDVYQLVVWEGDGFCTGVNGSRFCLQNEGDERSDGRGPGFGRLFENIGIKPAEEVADVPVSRKEKKPKKERVKKERRKEHSVDLGRRG